MSRHKEGIILFSEIVFHNDFEYIVTGKFSHFNGDVENLEIEKIVSPMEPGDETKYFHFSTNKKFIQTVYKKIHYLTPHF